MDWNTRTPTAAGEGEEALPPPGELLATTQLPLGDMIAPLEGACESAGKTRVQGDSMIWNSDACIGTQPDVSTATTPATSAYMQRSVRAVCVDFMDLGTVETKWGPKHQVKLVFETEDRKANGFPRTATRTHTLSYWEKAPLRRDLESWRGRPLTASQIQRGIRLSSLVGRDCELEVCDALSSKGYPYLKVVSIRKSEHAPLAVSGSYRRWDSRPGEMSAPQGPTCSSMASDAFADDDMESRLSQQAEKMLATHETAKEGRDE